MEQKLWFVPIPGTPKMHRLEENIVAVRVDLTPEDLRTINEGASSIQAEGDRYPEAIEKMTGL